MPPKTKTEEPEIPLLGRFTTQLKIGIVGLPNVGKSTFFNTLTKSSIPAQNYPFCTIEPNESRVEVPDDRFDFLVDYFKPRNHVPAFLNVVDIAGLVEGASEGQGLGNEFLSHIKACDALFHMIRAFDNEEIVHVNNDIDPLRDINIINEELRLKDLEYANSRLEQMNKTHARGNDQSSLHQIECLKKVKELLDNKKWVRNSNSWNAKEVECLNQHLFITAKPVIYLINIGKNEFIKQKNKYLSKIKNWVDQNDPNAIMIPFSAEFEESLTKLSDEEKVKFLSDNRTKSMMNKIIVSGFQLLKLQYFFTAGKDEVKAWVIQNGTKAPQAAGKIHTDFERGFIMAEVMKFKDFKELGSEAAVRNAGKYKQEGKQYTVEDGDIIFFKFNVTQQPKKK